ncbi:ribosome biogenesis protein ENP2 [Pancytospora philotis]|nr:ribosome biogenesis protein ENP2 [Pancytospora philotis]
MSAAAHAFTEIDCIKSFDYPVACTGVCIAPDQRQIVTIGIYKPCIKVFDLNSMTMKLERAVVTDALKVVALRDDAEKFCVLRNDRALEFHARSGLHDVVRVPHQPKDILFNAFAAECYASGEYDAVYRFNLQQGRFLRDIEVAGLTSLSLSPAHGLLAGVSADAVHFIDTRSRTEVIRRPIESQELTAVSQSDSGISYAVATADAVLEFDIRAEACVHKMAHEGPASRLRYSGKHIVYALGSRIFCALDGSSTVCAELDFTVNDFDVNEGLVVVGGEYEEMKCFKAPLLGAVPSWCADAESK